MAFASSVPLLDCNLSQLGEEKERTKAEGRAADALVSVAVTGPKNLWQNKATIRTGRSDRIIPGNAVDFPLHN